VHAAVKVFGRAVDPENFATEVYSLLTPGQVGCLGGWWGRARFGGIVSFDFSSAKS